MTKLANQYKSQSVAELEKSMKEIKLEMAKLIIEKKVKTQKNKCIKTKNQLKRKMCFDKVGSEVEKQGLKQKCPDMTNQMRSEFQNQESQMYPGQPASIQ